MWLGVQKAYSPVAETVTCDQGSNSVVEESQGRVLNVSLGGLGNPSMGR